MLAKSFSAHSRSVLNSFDTDLDFLEPDSHSASIPPGLAIACYLVLLLYAVHSSLVSLLFESRESLINSYDDPFSNAPSMNSECVPILHSSSRRHSRAK